MSVRAKFVVTSITRQKGWNGGPCEVQSIRLTPVVGGSEENKKFFAATPSGQVEISTVNVEAAKYFELDREYFLDFTKAE